MELIKPLDDLLHNEAFMGFEKCGDQMTGVAPGLIIGTHPHARFLTDMVACYNSISFCDDEGNQTAKTVVKYMTDYLVERGCVVEDRLQTVAGVTLYPTEYFCPKDYESGEIKLQEEELCAGAFFHKDNLPELPGKLSLARKLMDDWLDT